MIIKPIKRLLSQELSLTCVLDGTIDNNCKGKKLISKFLRYTSVFIRRNDNSSTLETSVFSEFRNVFSIDKDWPYTCTKDSFREDLWWETVSNYLSRTRKTTKTLYSFFFQDRSSSNRRTSSKIPHFLPIMLTILLNGTIELITMPTDIVLLVV